jgi:hypothetical protein
LSAQRTSGVVRAADERNHSRTPQASGSEPTSA